MDAEIAFGSKLGIYDAPYFIFIVGHLKDGHLVNARGASDFYECNVVNNKIKPL